VGAVLSQVQDGREVVVAYYSKALSAPEKNYCTTRRELLAVVKAVKHFRPYLYGRSFRLRTMDSGNGRYCRSDLRLLRQPSNDSWSRSSVVYTGKPS